MSEFINFSFDGRVYKLVPDFNLICEVEEELGGVPELLERFIKKKWQARELTVLMHILLYKAGRNIDFIELGNKLLKEGFEKSANSAKEFLQLTLNLK